MGEAAQFTYYISPTIRSGERSFDGVEIATPSGVVSVDSLRIAGVDQQDFPWTVNEDSLGFEVLLPEPAGFDSKPGRWWRWCSPLRY